MLNPFKSGARPACCKTARLRNLGRAEESSCANVPFWSIPRMALHCATRDGSRDRLRNLELAEWSALVMPPKTYTASLELSRVV